MRRLLTIAIVTVLALAFTRPRRAASWLGGRLGRALINVRSGDRHLTSNDPALRDLPRFTLSSDAFADGMPMPPPYIDAGAISPPLRWAGIPPASAQLALVVEDIDVPFPAPLVHALVYGIDPQRTTLAAGALPRPGRADQGDAALEIGRGAGGRAFLPPTPIPGHGPHRYVFQAFALREPLQFPQPPNKKQLLAALRRSAIARAIMVGTHQVG